MSGTLCSLGISYNSLIYIIYNCRSARPRLGLVARGRRTYNLRDIGLRRESPKIGIQGQIFRSCAFRSHDLEGKNPEAKVPRAPSASKMAEKERLAAALRENLQRRKTQVVARRQKSTPGDTDND